MKSVPIVLVGYNGQDFSESCIESIYRNTDITFDVIAVNNGSKDDTAKLFQKYRDKYSNFHFVNLSENKGFSGGYNAGMKYALDNIDFDHLLILNNDIITTPKYLSRLLDVYKSAKEDGYLKIGAVGPVTNYISGVQCIKAPELKTFKDIDLFSESIYENNRSKYFRNGHLIGFAMLFTKEMLLDVGLFDERFWPGEWEDSDINLRMQMKGYVGFVASDVFLYHYGSKTCNEVKKEMPTSFNDNRKKFIAKWNEINKNGTHKKLVGVCRVKNGEIYLNDTLEAVSRMCDELVVFDDHSTDKTEEICKLYSKVHYYKSTFDTFDEARDRNFILDKARELGAEWVYCFDSDEVPEESLIRDVQSLLNSDNPFHKAYIFKICHFWNSPKTIRLDGVWGGFYQCRLFKVEENQYVRSKSDDNLHCFIPGTKIVTNDNYLNIKNIEDIKINDYVLTHKGRYKKVNEVYKHNYKGNILNIKGIGFNLNVTENHPIYAFRPKKCEKKYGTKYCFRKDILSHCKHCNNKYKNELTWINSNDLQEGDFVATSRYNSLQSNNIFNSLEEAYLYGFFLGDGSLHYRVDRKGNPRWLGYVCLTIDKKDIETKNKVEMVCKKLGLTNVLKQKNVYRVILNLGHNRVRREFKDILINAGKGLNKKIDCNIFNLPEDYKLQVVQGMLDSDGSVNFKKQSNRFRVHNYHLAYGLNILLNSLNITSVLSSYNKQTSFDPNKIYNAIEYCVYINKNSYDKILKKNLSNNRRNLTKNVDGYNVSQITSIIKSKYEGIVYNLGVIGDNSYVANNVIVHNCGCHPEFAPENMAYTKFRIKHYGNMDPHVRKNKYEWYTKTDKDKDESLILGGYSPYYKEIYYNDTKAELKDEDYYRHIVDENKMELQTWSEDTSISVCIIAKNEEKHIENLLKSVTLVADEIIVTLDSTSTDKTEEICRKYTNNIYKYVWNDTGFSGMRNFCMSKARGAWILFLDGDELIPTGTSKHILEAVQRTDVLAYLCSFKNWQDGDIEGVSKWELSENFRLFKNIPHLYFNGVVHEELSESVEKLMDNNKFKVDRLKGVFYNYGYLKDKNFVEKKHLFYGELLKRQLEKNPNDFRAHMNYAVHLTHYKQYEEAEKEYKKTIELNPNFWKAYNGLGVLYFKKAVDNDYMTKAQINFQKALSKVKLEPFVHSNSVQRVVSNIKNINDIRKSTL